MQWKEIPEIELYSDGGADPNPGPGGFGVIMSYKGKRKEFSQGYENTTNNRMELMGVIFGLQQIKTKSKVEVFTDSRYVIDGIEKGWAKKWKVNDWMRNRKSKAINPDLWGLLLDEISKHEVTFHWVKGHAGHPENERCDWLAAQAGKADNLLEDEGYTPQDPNESSTTTTGTVHKRKKKKEGFTRVQKVGDACHNCSTPVVKKAPKKRKIKENQTYYFEWYLYCPSCKNMYMVEEAKKEVPKDGSLF